MSYVRKKMRFCWNILKEIFLVLYFFMQKNPLNFVNGNSLEIYMQ